MVKLEEEGELHRIKTEVDWDLELGAIMRKIYEINGPACLFEKVKGTELSLLSGALFGYKRYGMAIGSPPDLRSILKKLLLAIQNPIPPVLVSGAPCKENIDAGNKIDLEKFPAPKWHHLDGGRYFGTLGVVITKDPDTGIRNVAVYRQQMISKNRVTLLGSQHSGIHLQKYRVKKMAMPVATAIGVPPAVLVGAVINVPFGEDELGIAGGIIGEPIPLVKCETLDLEVPANAEIVLEGEIPPDESLWAEEGPFGEFTGYVSGDRPTKRPAIYLRAVTYRDNPIFQGTSPGVPPNEETTMRAIGTTVGAWHKLLKVAVPGIKEVYGSERAPFTIIISMDRQYYLGNARQVINAVWSTVLGSKWVIVVDDDINIFDRRQVEWALATRVQPHRDIIVTDDRYFGNQLDPSIHPEKRRYPYGQSSRIGIDATTKFKGDEFPPVVRSGEEQMKIVERRWKEYGFK
jgi:4-hydroxy-3-polyprenylbenzoate decarboxylase